MLKGDKLQASVSSVFDRFEVVFFQKSHNLAQTTNGWMIGTLPKRFPKFMVPKPIPKFTWHSFIKTSQRQVCFILNGSESWEMKQDVTWPSCWKFLLAFAKASMVHEDRRILAGPVLKGLLLVKSFQNPVSFSNKDSGTSIVSLHPRRGEKQLEEVNRYHRSAWTFRWKLGPMVNWLITYTLIDSHRTWKWTPYTAHPFTKICMVFCSILSMYTFGSPWAGIIQFIKSARCHHGFLFGSWSMPRPTSRHISQILDRSKETACACL